MVLWEHVMCGGHFWEKGGYFLDDTMSMENYKKTLKGGVGLTLEDTME